MLARDCAFLKLPCLFSVCALVCFTRLALADDMYTIARCEFLSWCALSFYHAHGNYPATRQAGRMHLWRLNVRTGKCVEERDIAPLNCDFPQVAPECVGRPCRYAYASHFISGFDIDGVSEWFQRV